MTAGLSVACSQLLRRRLCAFLGNVGRCIATSADVIIRNKLSLPPNSATNFAEYVIGGARGRENQTAVVCSDSGRLVSFGALKDAAFRWGGYLLTKGLGRGSVVAVLSPNMVDYPAVVFGTISVGCVYTGINPNYTATEVAHQLKDSGAEMVVVFGPLLEVAKKAMAINKHDLPMVAIGPSDGLPNVADIVQDATINFADPAKLRHQVSTYASAECPSLVMTLPMFHLSGFLAISSLAILNGIKLLNITKFKPQTFIEILLEHKVNMMHLVPSLLNFALAHPKFTRQNFSHVDAVLSGAAPVPPTAVAKVSDVIAPHGQLLHIYGMTETLISHQDPVGDTRVGFTGQLLPGLEGKVVDLTTGEDLPVGQVGELCTRGPTLMKAYHNNAEATAATLDQDGWLHSGDVGRYDVDGYVSVVDRIKELIKVNSLQVSPSEIEDVILQLPQVVEVSVVGVPHDMTGEAPRAYITTKGGIDEKTVMAHVQQHCAKHKHLTGGVAILAELPKNATGKVMRKELVKLAAAGK
ncbi:probable CoA ligase CCL5 [Hyalella azteca]|uniref:Probable CoA ligase CCL5 n=1 Tax=Hyalella azteca TaxID=294128 RepID=A0A8B7N8Q5_HYAAZ|nr:probable CoA ligase CCL5 [Hyalella azteca]